MEMEEFLSEDEENVDISNEMTALARDKLSKRVGRHYDKLKEARGEVEEAFPRLFDHGKSYVELLELSNAATDPEFYKECLDGVENARKEFEKLVCHYDSLCSEMKAVKELKEGIPGYSIEEGEFPDLTEVLQGHREAMQGVKCGWVEKWKTEISDKLAQAPTEAQVSAAIENDGLVVMDTSATDLVCPVLQTPIEGEAMKNPVCGHIYSKDGFQHLFAGTRAKVKSCPVAGCPKSVNVNEAIPVQV